MPIPASDAATRRPDLGAMVMEYMADSPTMGFIGLELLPLFPTRLQTSQFPVIPKEALLKIPETARAARAAYNRSDYEFERGYYATNENGWEEVVDDRERALYQDEFDAELVATMRATRIILAAQEKRIADKVFSATNFTANSITDEWDDAANAVPIDDVNEGKLSVRENCGMLPNVLVISYSTFLNLKRCDQVVDLLKFTFPGIDINRMSAQQLAAVFDVERVLVGGAVYDSAKKGQDASISDLWSNEYAMLTRVASGQSLDEPCLGRTFLWTEDADSNSVVEQYREEGTRGDVIRVRHDTDERLLTSFDSSGSEDSTIYKAVSYLFSNVTT